MDAWDFKKWRKALRYTQVQAAEQLGLSRGTIQNWENEHTPIPRMAELACVELTRRWRQCPEFGPVTLVYADSPMVQQADGSYRVPAMQYQRYANNEAALDQARLLKRCPSFVRPLIMDDEGDIVWSGAELLRAGHQRKEDFKGKNE